MITDKKEIESVLQIGEKGAVSGVKKLPLIL